ncbi:pantetheine-phosphate adenylyltransferase [Myxococcota bacterium]|nr:pantetheine-phosphate adenylyltransferase [Myxococcota bacterium]MBU1537790.1 pantetheine-phosphate adenylyltransferase [Myxococcota bacterium]
METKTAVYPGSFDPVTHGHIDIISRGLEIFDRVVVAVATNSEKRGLFSISERVDLLSRIFAHENRVEVVSFHGLLVDYLKGSGYKTILRGLRAISDFEYEFQIANMNVHLYPEVDSVFLMTSQKYFYISSSVVKEVAHYGGDVSAFVPENVVHALKEKFNQE